MTAGRLSASVSSPPSISRVTLTIFSSGLTSTSQFRNGNSQSIVPQKQTFLEANQEDWRPSDWFGNYHHQLLAFQGEVNQEILSRRAICVN